MDRRFMRILTILLSFLLILQLSVVSFAEAAEEAADTGEEEAYDEDGEEEDTASADGYEKFSINGYAFEVSTDWDVEEDEVFNGCDRVSFTVDDEFSVKLITVSEESADGLMNYVYENLPDQDLDADDASHRVSCLLCGIDCPSGRGLRASQLNVTDHYDIYSSLLWFIYDKENYVKGGAYSSEDTRSIIIAADCSDLTPARDAALTRILSTIEVSDEADTTANTIEYTEIDVPDIEQTMLEIDPIMPSAAAADPAEFIICTGSMNAKEQKDVYTFTAPYDGRYRFELANVKSGVETELYVYNDLDEKLAVNPYCSNGEGVTVKNLSAGETYRVIILQRKKLGEYTLKIGQQKETVDIYDITLLTDSIEYTDQRNVYSFTVPRDGRYRFKFAEMMNGFEVEMLMFNDLEETVAKNSYCSNGKGFTVKDLIAGDVYQIQVRQSKKTGSYTLTVN